MRISARILLAATALLAAACSNDTRQVLAPDAPARSTWTRTYYVTAMTYVGTHPFNAVPASYSAGYVKVELVPDNPAMGAYELGRVDASGDPASFYKPADNSVRLTAVSTLSNCSFWGWAFGTSTSTSTTATSINMDDYRPYYQVTGKFLCS
ncbi:hypothetical protein [Longimicrobium sp.]|uniref:hypothetical protein n=1 Tax=Longimicrobium sp. TaxID=2029185 RepID=UPI002BEE847A|nr:hypothetical protein [Longimicrobium sp.]HSU12608.1 hypothetical protein [Longimicrobium sp.]